jgi:hypothetical protein
MRDGQAEFPFFLGIAEHAPSWMTIDNQKEKATDTRIAGPHESVLSKSGRSFLVGPAYSSAAFPHACCCIQYLPCLGLSPYSIGGSALRRRRRSLSCCGCRLAVATRRSNHHQQLLPRPFPTNARLHSRVSTCPLG